MATPYNGNPAGPVADPITLPDDGDDADAASINTALQPLQDSVVFLAASKLALAGGTMTGLLTTHDVTVPAGKTLTIANTATLDLSPTANVNVNTNAMTMGAASVVTAVGGALMKGAWKWFSTSTAEFAGKINLSGRKRVRVRVPLTDADHTVDVSQGDVFELVYNPAAVRTITVDKVGVVPDNGESMTFVVSGPLATGQQYIFKRNAGTTIAEFHGNAAGDAGAFARFDFDGTDMRLGENSGGGANGGVKSFAAS